MSKRHTHDPSRIRLVAVGGKGGKLEILGGQQHSGRRSIAVSTFPTGYRGLVDPQLLAHRSLIKAQPASDLSQLRHAVCYAQRIGQCNPYRVTRFGKLTAWTMHPIGWHGLDATGRATLPHRLRRVHLVGLPQHIWATKMALAVSDLIRQENTEKPIGLILIGY